MRLHRRRRPSRAHDQQGADPAGLLPGGPREFGLSANLAIRAIARVCAALKVPEKAHSAFKPTSIDYDARIFSFREWDWTVSLTLLDSRQRIETMPGEHQKEVSREPSPPPPSSSSGKAGSSCTSRSAARPPSRSSPTDFIGVDLGIAKIATTSDDPEGHSGEARRKDPPQAQPPAEATPAEGNQGSQEEAAAGCRQGGPVPRHENHFISKAIVQSAKDTGRGIALEDLKGIRGRVTARGGDARNRLSGWSFHQLCGFLVLQGAGRGNPHRFVDPRNTSRTCSVCGHCEKANRKSQAVFLCKHCGFSANADWNAARNIRALAESKAATELAIVEAKTGKRTAAEISRKATALQCG